MNDLQDFFHNAKERNLCARGAQVWEHCKSKKSLIDFCLSGWGCDYVATAIADGWGISPEVIAQEFAAFNCGKYTRSLDGYTSQIYCLCEEESIIAEATVSLIIGFNGRIVIPENHICELYICNSNVEICGEGHGMAFLYRSTVANECNSNITVENRSNGG